MSSNFLKYHAILVFFYVFSWQNAHVAFVMLRDINYSYLISCCHYSISRCFSLSVRFPDVSVCLFDFPMFQFVCSISRCFSLSVRFVDFFDSCCDVCFLWDGQGNQEIIVRMASSFRRGLANAFRSLIFLFVWARRIGGNVIFDEILSAYTDIPIGMISHLSSLDILPFHFSCFVNTVMLVLFFYFVS